MDFNPPEWDQLLRTLMTATMLMAALGLGSALYDRHQTPTATCDSAPAASDAQDRVFKALVSGLR